MLEQAVELGKINLSEDDPDVLLTAYELGRVLQQADDPMAARRVLEEAYAAGQWRLGDSDPLMLQISHDIGVVAEELGNRHEARKAFTRVAEFGPAALGAGHGAVARAQAYLGPDQLGVRGESAPKSSGNESPTTVFEAVTPVAVAGRVQPPSAENQSVWAGGTEPEPPVAAPRAVAAVEEPTVAQPVIAARSDGPAATPPPFAGGAQIPAQRSESGYPDSPSAGSTYQDTAPADTQPASPSGEGPYPGTPSVRTHPDSPSAGGSYPTAPLSGGSFPGGPSSGSGYQHGAAYPGAPFSGQPHGQAGFPGGAGSPHGQASGAGVHGAAGAGQEFAPAYLSDGFNPYAQASASPIGRKGLGVFAAIAAVLAAVIAVAALVFVLANRSSDSSDSDNVPTLAGAAPSDVKLRDTGTTIGVTWTDPTESSVSFMVIMGRPGLELKPVGTLGPGQTSFEMSGLNASVNYCFAVVAVYRGNQFATSPQACTARASAAPR